MADDVKKVDAGEEPAPEVKDDVKKDSKLKAFGKKCVDGAKKAAPVVGKAALGLGLMIAGYALGVKVGASAQDVEALPEGEDYELVTDNSEDCVEVGEF